jgi:hypothetical protein
MPADTAFRTAIQPKTETAPEAKNPDPVLEPSKTAEPIALYEELNGKPYSAKYFDVGDIWDKSDSMAEDLRTIDSYYRTKVQMGELEDGPNNYKKLIEEAEKATNTKNSNFNLRVAKIAEFVRFMEKMDKIDRERIRYGTIE